MYTCRYFFRSWLVSNKSTMHTRNWRISKGTKFVACYHQVHAMMHTQTLTVTSIYTDTQLFTYKVAMGACLGLAALMLLTLGIVFVCFLIHRQRRISQGTHQHTVYSRDRSTNYHMQYYLMWTISQPLFQFNNKSLSCLHTINGKTFSELKACNCFNYLSTIFIVSNNVKKTFRFQLSGGKERERRVIMNCALKVLYLPTILIQFSDGSEV